MMRVWELVLRSLYNGSIRQFFICFCYTILCLNKLNCASKYFQKIHTCDVKNHHLLELCSTFIVVLKCACWKLCISTIEKHKTWEYLYIDVVIYKTLLFSLLWNGSFHDWICSPTVYAQMSVYLQLRNTKHVSICV